jgi:hypothetical protein
MAFRHSGTISYIFKMTYILKLSVCCFNISDVFKFDPEYEANEEKYSSLRKEILDEGSSSSEGGSGLEEENDSEEESENGKQQVNCQ